MIYDLIVLNIFPSLIFWVLGLIQCGELKAPHNGKLIYGNEHGRIVDTKPNYPMGTFVEVHCTNGTIVKGEGFLSCIDSGTWDFPVPECIDIPKQTATMQPFSTMLMTSRRTTAASTSKPPAATHRLTKAPTTKKAATKAKPTTKMTPKVMSKTTLIPKTTIANTTKSTTTIPKAIATVKLQYDTVSTTSISTGKNVQHQKPFEVHMLPDKQFWIDLKQLYYYGCNNLKVKPTLCRLLKNASHYTDLTQFELPETNDFKDMDQHLLTHLMHAEQLLSDRSVDTNLTVEHLFSFILYGNNVSTAQRMPLTTENAYRFVLCLYIDTILVDKNLKLSFVQMPPSDEENITQQLKYLLVRVTSKAFENYSVASLIGSTEEPTTDQTNAGAGILTGQPNNGNRIRSSNEQTSTESEERPQKIMSTKKLNNFDLIVESESIDDSCQLEALPETPSNSFISEIKTDSEIIFNMPDRLYLIGPVSIRTRAYFGCNEGFKPRSNIVHFFECNETLKWFGHPIECERMCFFFCLHFHISMNPII